MTDTKQIKRKRLQPEERKNQILDVAANLIREHGVSALNMDRLGREAGVSKPLVYNYFTNRIELLKVLLIREVTRFRQDSTEAARSRESMEDLVRSTSRTMLQHVGEFGNVIQQLMLEPEVAEVLEEIDSKFHRQYSDFLIKRIRSEYELSTTDAAAAVHVGLGLSSAAGAYLEKKGIDIEFLEDILTEMTMGSLEKVAEGIKAGRVRSPKESPQIAAE